MKGEGGRPRAEGIWGRLEGGLLVLVMGSLLVLTGTQILFRNLFGMGLPWADPFSRIAVFWVALAGAMAAGRGNRHIGMEGVTRHLPSRLRCAVRAFTALGTAGISGTVAYHSLRFVIMEGESAVKAFGEVPVWPFQVMMPLAFSVLALRYGRLGISQLAACRKGDPCPSSSSSSSD